jgi:hypothetical protein
MLIFAELQRDDGVAGRVSKPHEPIFCINADGFRLAFSVQYGGNPPFSPNFPGRPFIGRLSRFRDQFNSFHEILAPPS